MRWTLYPILFTLAVGAAPLPGRYIVELNTEPVAEHVAKIKGRPSMRSAAASDHRSRVRGEQQKLRPQFEAQQGQVLGSVDTVANAMFVQISDEKAAQLASLPGVKRVLPVRIMHMALDRAVLLHKAPDAWNQVGLDRAGLGMKIAIIDSGIDSTHAGFQDASMSAPDTFPRSGAASDLAYTNGKIIVARSYVSLLPNRDPDPSARDHVGHGTALAMVAAGVRNAGPLATIAGVAPKAWLGNYKVFGTPGFNDSASDDAILKAIDDAVADGMDVINLSLGDDLAPRLSDDVEAQAIERATQAGVIVVVAAGNNGPGLNTISSPATAPSAIAVGATTNDRSFAATVDVPGLSPLVALPGDGPLPATPITAPFVDVSSIDSSGLACGALPENSLAGAVALILRGTCTFQIKMNNAQHAGAVGAIVYAAQSAPSAIPMALGGATLPAEMVSYDDGLAIKQSLASTPALAGTMQFNLNAVSIAANRLTDFSAAGPSVDLSIKPEVTAVGGDIYVATQKLDINGEMYDPSGYILVDGTSFSTPLVAGAAALIKSARPGLTVNQYRSLLINTGAAVVQTGDGATSGVQRSGGGLLDVSAALNSTVAAYPALLSLGNSRTLTLSNLGGNADTFTITAAPRSGSAVPTMASSVQVAAGGSVDVPLTWNTANLASGTYEGFLTVSSSSTGTKVNVPYWYDASSGEPANITILDAVSSGRRSSVQRQAVLLRTTDVSGQSLLLQPEVTVVSGGGSVRAVTSLDNQVPGMFSVDVVLGPAAGTNVFRIQSGSVTTDITITGQ